MFYQLYNILFTFLLILASPYVLFRSLLQEKFRKALPQRMGFFESLSFEKPIWFHAASVGEVFCSLPLLKKIRKEFPRSKIVLTTVTSTGNEAAKTRAPEADRVLFLPVDHPFAVWRAIERIQPGILLIAETELWPNLLRSCGKKGIPVVLFNGRISQRSFRRYSRFKFFFKDCLKYISLFLMQTEEDRKRIESFFCRSIIPSSFGEPSKRSNPVSSSLQRQNSGPICSGLVEKRESLSFSSMEGSPKDHFDVTSVSNSFSKIV